LRFDLLSIGCSLFGIGSSNQGALKAL